MSSIFKVSSEKAVAIRRSTRVVFLLIGFGLLIMELLFPPVKMLWLTLGYLLGAILILFTIMGLTPSLRLTGFGKVIDNTIFHVLASSLIGMGIMIAAMINPPVHIIWFAYFNLVGVLLVFDAIITSTWHASK